MANRDVETFRSKAKFIATLRRVADALENGQPVRIQVAARRFSVPAHATLSVEHEVEGTDEELELQLKWQNSAPDSKSATPPKKKRARRS